MATIGTDTYHLESLATICTVQHVSFAALQIMPLVLTGAADKFKPYHGGTKKKKRKLFVRKGKAK